MPPIQDYTKFPFLKNAAMRSSFFLAVSGMLLSYSACDMSNATKAPFEKGVITVLEEDSNGKFLIADETLTDKKTDSRLITKYNDGRVDTFDHNQIRSASARYKSGGGSSVSFDDDGSQKTTNPDGTPINADGTSNTNTAHRSGGSSFFMNYMMFRAMSGGMMGNSMSNNAMHQPRPSAYKNQSTYQRVNNASKGYFSKARSTASRSSSRSSGRSGGRFGG